MAALWRGSLATFALLWLGLAGVAQAAPVPFEATYQLTVRGWPDAQIQHRLSRQGALWQSEMRAAISIAEGEELSRFRLTEDRVDARFYASGYQLLGFGKQYRLARRDLTELPDRQSALFALSRRVDSDRCTHSQVAPCRLRYLNYEGEEETLAYRVVGRDEVQLPAGTFPRVRVDSWNPEKPDRHLLLGFHPAIPGLLLSVDYYRDGEHKSHLALMQLTLTGESPSDQKN